MDLLYIALLILVISTLNIVCFFIGAKVGQKVVNKEELKMPSLNPIAAVKSYEERKEQEEIEKTYKDNMEAIDNYKGDL